MFRPFCRAALGIAGLGLMAGTACAADEGIFLEQLHSPSEQALGQGHTALWTLPLVATQYQPLHVSPAIQKALQAQNDGRFIEALIALDEAGKSGQGGPEADLLRASFLLQGNQSRQAQEVVAPLFAQPQYAADAHALTSMAYLQLGQMQQAQQAAQRAHDAGGGTLSHLVLSYALQGSGQLEQAVAAVHDFNAGSPQAVTLAREAELELTQGRVQTAQALVRQAQGMDAASSYVAAVSGLVSLIDGRTAAAKTEFEAALRRDPKDAKALLGLGLAEIKLGNLHAGQEKLQAADESDSGNALILTYLGRAQRQAGQAAEARASWRRAQQADPKDPTPWLYQAQAELQDNRPQDARDSLREAQARVAYRSVYRSSQLLKEDERLLQTNLAEVQRRLGLDNLSSNTLADAGGQDAQGLRNQADALQGRRFGESARRSLLLQSLFNEQPGNLPSELDIYGDGAGQTGASVPQHGAVGGLGAQQASYNNYDALFNRGSRVEVDAINGDRSNGAQLRAGLGSDTLGLSVAHRQYKSDGFAPYDNLDNRIGQAVVQWRPAPATQAFASHQRFHSYRGETFFPGTTFIGYNGLVLDNSYVTRFGLCHTTDGGEWRALWSVQQTDQANNNTTFFGAFPFSQSGSSIAHGAELQYRSNGADHTTLWGVQAARGRQLNWMPGLVTGDASQIKRQVYVLRQQTLNPHWKLEAGLGWGKADQQDNLRTVGLIDGSTSLKDWLPRLGAVYTPDERTHLRAAAWQGIGTVGVGDATLAPATLAGALLAHPGENGGGDIGQLLKAVALGADRQLSPSWLLEAKTQQRKTDLPIKLDSITQRLVRQKVEDSRLALHWQPQNRPWAVSLAYDDERLQYDPTTYRQDALNEQHLRSQQLGLRWFAAAHLTANLQWSHNLVNGSLLSDPDPITGRPTQVARTDGFNQVDAEVDWQFDQPRGSLVAGVRNAAGTRFQYTEIDKLNPRFSNGRLSYLRLKLAW